MLSRSAQDVTRTDTSACRRRSAPNPTATSSSPFSSLKSAMRRRAGARSGAVSLALERDLLRVRLAVAVVGAGVGRAGLLGVVRRGGGPEVEVGGAGGPAHGPGRRP